MSIYKSGRLTNLSVTAAMLIMLTVPHVAAFLGANASLVENRKMAPMPDSHLLLESFPEYAARFDSYYGEAFGLRDSLIRWNNRLRLFLFNESPVPKVRVGRDGWLFYADEWVFDDYENVMPYKQNELAAIRRILKERREWLDRLGIKFYVIVTPNKHTIYNEYLPPKIHKIGKKSRLDEVAESLRSEPEINFIDPRDALLRAKPMQRLYHRTDTHWNDYGAFIGYTELMNHITRDFPSVRKHTIDDYTLSIKNGAGGDLAGLLSLADVIGEERITLSPKFTTRARDGKRTYPDPVDLVTYPGRDMVIKETGDESLPRVLVFRDSFSWPLIPFLSETFQSSVFVWTFDFLPELIEREKPDIVILQCVERYLNALTLENPPEVRKTPAFPSPQR